MLHSNTLNIKRGRHELSNDSKGSPSNSQRGNNSKRISNTNKTKRTASKLNVQSEDKEENKLTKKNTKKTKTSHNTTHSSNQHVLGIANESSDAKTERSSVELVQGTSYSDRRKEEKNAVAA